MTNRLKAKGETASWRLMVAAALSGAIERGYTMKRQPGRGLSNTYEMTKDGETKIASVRTTRDRWIAFPPLEGGARWKTLDDVDLVLVSAVDDPHDPQSVDVYLFPADEVKKRFDDSYAARIAKGHTVRDNYGMWVTLDKGDDAVATQVGHSLAVDFPAIAHYTIDELEADADTPTTSLASEAEVPEEEASSATGPDLGTVVEVLTFARERIASLTGMPIEAVKLDLKMGL